MLLWQSVTLPVGCGAGVGVGVGVVGSGGDPGPRLVIERQAHVGGGTQKKRSEPQSAWSSHSSGGTIQNGVGVAGVGVAGVGVGHPSGPHGVGVAGVGVAGVGVTGGGVTGVGVAVAVGPAKRWPWTEICDG